MIELFVEDDANNPNEAVTLVNLMDERGVLGLIGAASSPVALAQAGPVEASGIPEMVVAASDAISSPFQYQINPPDSEQILGLIAFAEDRGFSRIAIMTDTGAYGTGSKAALDRMLPEAGLEIVGDATFEPGASNLTPQLSKLRDSDPDLIAMFTFGSPYAAAMQGLQQIQWSVPVFGNVSSSDPSVGVVAGAAADGLFFQQGLDDEKPEAQAFIDVWSAKHPDEDPDFVAAMAYDAVSVFAMAVEAGATTREQVQAWLLKNVVPGLATGRVDSAWDLPSHRALKGADLSYFVWTDGVPERVAE
ncbi:hypothetical protein AU252_00910 [Pseudarthrobacter sulfonivorans]|uniref:Leucine-binding protein domain-containing protein n=2 Tax=Pseudarthrobacter sulfonivorans TaxID=121292 RepID=A0A0U3QEG0_9MICC|nr:hypothetical protein AU252_00910 [Pseudarthrobacter sulfonivorans]